MHLAPQQDVFLKLVLRAGPRGPSPSGEIAQPWGILRDLERPQGVVRIIRAQLLGFRPAPLDRRLHKHVLENRHTMHALPHRYRVNASGRVTGDVELTAGRLTALQSASPAEFDGPGDRWSPETFLVGAVADCFVLTFRAVAKASNVPWLSLECDAIGTLDRIDRVMQFTRFDLTARLLVPAGVDADAARHALDKAKRNCLISSSLKADVVLDATLDIAPAEEVLA